MVNVTPEACDEVTLMYSELERVVEEAVVAYYNVRIMTAEKLTLYYLK
jgi:hypothetical protein